MWELGGDPEVTRGLGNLRMDGHDRVEFAHKWVRLPDSRLPRSSVHTHLGFRVWGVSSVGTLPLEEASERLTLELQMLDAKLYILSPTPCSVVAPLNPEPHTLTQVPYSHISKRKPVSAARGEIFFQTPRSQLHQSPVQSYCNPFQAGFLTQHEPLGPGVLILIGGFSNRVPLEACMV